MTDKRRTELMRAACNHIIGALECDLNGGEFIMKEFWEQCDSQEDQRVGDELLRATIEFLRFRRP